ncbi:MAG: hypothetical protein PUA93_05555 [Eubacteriales bacterium]|nr:hypothetical protein [Eubacteriales bacterium]
MFFWDSRLSCDRCNASLKGCSYQYQLVKITDTWGNPIRLDQDDPDKKAVVHIILTCPKCGAVKEYDKTFNFKNGENIDYIVQSFLRENYR